MTPLLEVYHERPRKVEAMQVPPPGHEYAAQGKELTDWLEINKVEYAVHPDAVVYIKGLDAWTQARPGTWILKDESGKFCVKEDHIFQSRFEKITALMMLLNQVRPILQKMALKAEQKMALHDPHKGDSWKQCEIEFLEDKLREEVKEYFDTSAHIRTRAMELPDIVNICAMLYARHYGFCDREESTEESEGEE